MIIENEPSKIHSSVPVSVTRVACIWPCRPARKPVDPQSSLGMLETATSQPWYSENNKRERERDSRFKSDVVAHQLIILVGTDEQAFATVLFNIVGGLNGALQ